DDFHEVLGAQLANHRPKDTGADWLVVIVENNSGIAIKANGGSVFAEHFLGGAHDDGLTHVALFHATARDGFLDRNYNNVSDTGVATVGTTQNLDALNTARAAVVSNIQVGL